MKKIYLAHPISLMSADEVFNYYDNMVKILSGKYEILFPMYGKDVLRTEKKFRAEGYGDPVSTNHAIFERDSWMVSQSDIIFCDLRNTKNVSIGCCMELAIGSWLNKHTVVVMESSNIHNHAFIKEAADIVFDNMNEALLYINQLA